MTMTIDSAVAVSGCRCVGSFRDVTTVSSWLALGRQISSKSDGVAYIWGIILVPCTYPISHQV